MERKDSTRLHTWEETSCDTREIQHILAARMAALPPNAGGENDSHGIANNGSADVCFTILDSMTVK